MKKSMGMTITIAAVLALALAAAGRPYEEVMKEVGAACGSLKKNIDAKQYTEAGADAKKLEALFGEVHKFWKAKKATDAVAFSKDARAAAKLSAAAAKSSNGEEAQKSFEKLVANCKGCHAAHREKAPDGKWRIKA